MSGTAAVGVRAAIFSAEKARKFWKGNLARNLNREVLSALEKEPGFARDILIRDWEVIREDSQAAYFLKELLKHPSSAVYDGLAKRILEIARSVDANLTSKEREQRLVEVVRRSLHAAQRDARASTEYSAMAVLEKVEDVHADLRAQIAQVPAALIPAARVSLVLPGDIDDREAAILEELRAVSEEAATRLAGVVQRGGAAAAEKLLADESLPFGLLMAVGRMLMVAGSWAAASRAFGRAVDDGESLGRALVAQATAVEVAGDESAANALLKRAARDAPSDLYVRVELASRISDPAERKVALDALHVTTPRLQARLLAERASVCMALRLYPEAQRLAAQSVEADRLGPGDEMAATAAVFRAADDPDFRARDQDLIRTAAGELAELANQIGGVDRQPAAQLCQARAALGFALSDEDERVRELCEHALERRGDVEVGGATWVYVQAALAIGDGELASSFSYERPGSAEQSLVNMTGKVFTEKAGPKEAAELGELSRSTDPDIASYADDLRLLAAHSASFPLPDDVVARRGPTDPAVGCMEAFRLADEGALTQARERIEDLEDVQSLTVRAELARRDSDFASQAALLQRVYDLRPTALQGFIAAKALAQVPELERARRDAENVARRHDASEQIRCEALALAAQCAADASDWEDMQRIAETWLKYPWRRDAAVWASLFASAKQELWDETLDAFYSEQPKVNRLDQAELLAVVISRAGASQASLQTLADLSDQFDRPESLEYALLTTTLGSEHLITPDSPLDIRVRATFADFGDRFPRSALVRSITIDPDDPIGSLERAISPDSKELEELRRAAEVGIGDGTVPVAFLADTVSRPTVDVLARLHALPLGPAGAEGIAAAADAISKGRACWTADALAVVAGLPQRLREKLTGVLPRSLISRTVFGEAATSTPRGKKVGFAQRGSDGTLRLVEADQGEETRVAEALRRTTALAKTLKASDVAAADTTPPELARAFDTRSYGRHSTSVLQTMELARQRGLPLFAADRAVRAFARQLDVPTFGVLDLLEAIQPGSGWGEEDGAETTALLRLQGAWGVPTADAAYLELAKRSGWSPGHGGWRAVWTDHVGVIDDTPKWVTSMCRVLVSVAESKPAALPEWAEAITLSLVAARSWTYQRATAELVQGLLRPDSTSSPELAASAIDAVLRIRFLRAYPYGPLNGVLIYAFRSILNEGSASFDETLSRVPENLRSAVEHLRTEPPR